MNITFREIRSLKNKKGRDLHGLFIVEGAKFVADIPPGWEIVCRICAESYSGAVPDGSEIVSDKRFASLTDTVTPQGILAVVKKNPAHTPTDTARRVPTPFYLLCERLQDPGNIGTLIRTAAAAGADAVLLSGGCGDVYNPKTLRASAGAVLKIPVTENADLRSVIAGLQEDGVFVAAASPHGTKTPYELDFTGGCAILAGNESAGISGELAAAADALVKLPMAAEIESLNASVAGGVLLYEVLRQRLAADEHS